MIEKLSNHIPPLSKIEPLQLSFFEAGKIDLNSGMQPRAILGSLAMNNEQRRSTDRTPIEVSRISRNDGTGRSVGSQLRQGELDRAAARSNSR